MADFSRLRPPSGLLGSKDEPAHTESSWQVHRNMLQNDAAAHRERIEVEGVSGAFVVSNVLSVAEVQEFIALSEEIGFGTGEEVVNVPREVRNNDAVVFFPPSTVLEELSARLAPFVPQEANGKQRSRIFVHSFFRVYRYDASKGVQQFGPHLDGSQLEKGIINDQQNEDISKGTDKSLMSILLYLNDVPGESGGRTIFYPDGDPEQRSTSVNPTAGSALCFWHGEHPLSPLHEGEALKRNDDVCVKYVIRTDVLFHTPAVMKHSDEWESSSYAMAAHRAFAVWGK